MKIEIQSKDLPMLLKMVERGWSDGDLAEYLSGDQIQSCERVLIALGLNQSQPVANPAVHSLSQ